MKEIILSDEVQNKIRSLLGELHALCVAHELPFVAATVLARTPEDDGFRVERCVSVYINSETGATEPSIRKAGDLLSREPEANPIAKLILGALIAAAGDDCDCPKCRERRAEAE